MSDFGTASNHSPDLQRPTSTFRRLSFAMAAFGVIVGLMFPPFAGYMLDTDAATHPAFWVACVAAGILVGVVNFVLVHGVVGRHVRRLALAMRTVNEKVAVAKSVDEGCGEACRIPVTSTDSLGDVERAFNDMARAVAGRIRLELAVGDMLSAAAESAELEAVAHAVLTGLMHPVSSRIGLLYAVSGTQTNLLARRGFDAPESPGLDLSNGPVADALSSMDTVFLDPEVDGLAWLAQSTPLGSMRPKAVALIPLVAEQRCVALAVIGVAASSVVEAQRPVLDGCRHRAGPQLLNAILHKKLQEMAAMDELTGVLNRRFGARRLDEEYARSVRHGVPLAVFLLDIDHFKRFNDTHGHDAGDEVLRHVARTLENTVRSSDVVCRYGGEEFLVLAPGAGTQDGVVLADRLRRRIESIDIQWKGQRLTVHASFGVASWPSVRASAPHELVTRADEALYAAKAAGRNRVFVHDGTAARPGELKDDKQKADTA